MFCTQCGNRLEQNQNFYPRCGSRTVNAAAQNMPPSQQAAANRVQPAQLIQHSATQPVKPAIWVFQTTRKLSAFKLVPCCIVFMNDRLVLAHITPALQKAETQRLSGEIKQSGKGFLSGSGAMMSYWADYYKKYYNMSAEAIVAQDPANVMIYYASITSMMFRCYSEGMLDDDGHAAASG